MGYHFRIRSISLNNCDSPTVRKEKQENHYKMTFALSDGVL
jgi:hypothetical protein